MWANRKNTEDCFQNTEACPQNHELMVPGTVSSWFSEQSAHGSWNSQLTVFGTVNSWFSGQSSVFSEQPMDVLRTADGCFLNSRRVFSEQPTGVFRTADGCFSNSRRVFFEQRRRFLKQPVEVCKTALTVFLDNIRFLSTKSGYNMIAVWKIRCIFVIEIINQLTNNKNTQNKHE